MGQLDDLDDQADASMSTDSRLRAIIEQSAPVILQIDPLGAITFAAGYHLETLGLSDQTLVSSPFHDFLSGHEATMQTFREALAGEFCTTEIHLGGCDFEIRLTPMVDQRGNISGVTAFFADITARARAADELRRSESSFRVLIESSPDAVFVHRFSRIVYANNATRRILGYSKIGEVLGIPVLELFSKEDRPQVAQRIRQTTEKSDSYMERYKLINFKGTVGTFEVTTMAVQYDGESAIVHIARDITQSLRMQTKLAQTERLASLGTLAGGVGHEINNPLAYMTANLSFIADELDEMLPRESSDVNEDIHSALQDVRDGTDRVRDIVRQLNEFTRVDSDTEELIDPRTAAEYALRRAWTQLRKHSRVETRLGPVGFVRGNQARLGQAFLALLLNATEALSAQALSDSELIVECYERDETITIEIKDNGPGIPEKFLANIFDPFFSANASGQGTGLGLSVAHSIVVGMGGHIEIDTEIGKGTVARIQLPRVQGCPREPQGDRNILVVTDEIRFLESAQIALRGHRIRLAGRMNIAISDLENRSYDAVLCDLTSADADILAFATKAKAAAGIVVFVAQSGTVISKEATELATLLLRKPVGADGIAMQLAKLWKT